MEGETKVSVDLCGEHFIKCDCIGQTDRLERQMGLQFGNDTLGNDAEQERERETRGE